MDTEHLFARNDVWPSWLPNALGKFLSLLAEGFTLTQSDATHVQVTASANTGAAIIAIQGRWRWIEATVTRAHPGGAAGTYDVFVTASETAIAGDYSDTTNYAFDLAIVAHGATPTIVAGTVDVFRKIGEVVWSGSAITAVHQLVPALKSHAFSHAPGGLDQLFGLTDANMDAAHVDGAPGTASLRTLGVGPDQAAAGDDVRLSDTRIPSDGSVTNIKVAAAAAIAYSKLNLTGSIVNADIGAAAAIAYSKLSLGASIVNADIAAAAAIAYSKLNLTNSITNADVAAAAAIAYTKLNLAGAIVNADIATAAAIAYSKLNLGGSIVNADIAAAAAIAESKLSLASDAAAGTASRRTLGTGAQQAAAGNDSRITGAAQKASNLSDLASAAAARTNLGLPDGSGNAPFPQLPSSRQIRVSCGYIDGINSVIGWAGTGDWTVTFSSTGHYTVHNAAWPATLCPIVTSGGAANTVVADISSSVAGSFSVVLFNALTGADNDTFLFFVVYY